MHDLCRTDDEWLAPRARCHARGYGRHLQRARLDGRLAERSSRLVHRAILRRVRATETVDRQGRFAVDAVEIQGFLHLRVRDRLTYLDERRVAADRKSLAQVDEPERLV